MTQNYQEMAAWGFWAHNCLTLGPFGGKNKCLSEFSFEDLQSAQNSGRFDLVTSESNIFFENIVIYSWSKP